MSRYPDHVNVAIIGSGPVGAAFARVLREEASEASVAIFEVGPAVTDPLGSHVKNIDDEDARAHAQRRSEGPGVVASNLDAVDSAQAGARNARPGTYLLDSDYVHEGEDGLPYLAFSSNVGGMGAHWTGACPRPGEDEVIDFIDDLDDLLDEAEGLLGVHLDVFDEALFGELVRERLSVVTDAVRPFGRGVQRMPLAVRRDDDGRILWSGSDVVFGESTLGYSTVSLFTDSLVTRVLHDSGRVSGVEVKDLESGHVHEVAASIVVVAADGLRTPQVLYASDIRPAALGRMLNDQTQIMFAARITDSEETARARGKLAASAPSEGPLNLHSGVSWVPYTRAEPFHGQIMQLDASPIPMADDDEVLPGSIVGLGLFCAKDLQWDDRVDFSDAEVDAYGMPKMSIHYTLTDKDRADRERGKQIIRAWAQAIGEPLDDHVIELPLGASLHYQGAVRMGVEDDGTSVCSPASEVWNINGLFVGGNGVIPTSTACNPTLTSVALAIKAAREIRTRLRNLHTTHELQEVAR